MPWSMAWLSMQLPALMLILSRVSALTISLPVLDGRLMPRRVKIMVAVALSVMIFPVVTPELPASISLSEALVGMVGEVLIGLTIGFLVKLVFLAAQLAGLLVSRQAGIALGGALNPLFDESSMIVEQLYMSVAILLFVLMGGMRAMVMSVMDSFHSVPPMAFRYDPAVLEVLIGSMGSAFELAIRLSGPVLSAMLLALLALGFLSRTVPQLHLLSVGLSIKTMVAVSLIAITLHGMADVLSEAFADAIATGRAILGLAEPGW